MSDARDPDRMPSLPTAGRLFEAHLTVSDLDRAVAFYRDVVGLPLAHHLPDRGAAFHWIGSRGDSMLGLWLPGSAPVRISSHVAFSASLEDVLGACGALQAAGITPRSFSGAETTEPSVIGWMPAAAIYFDDPDGNQLEYLAMLPGPGRPEVGIVSWSQWIRANPTELEIELYEGVRDALRPLFAQAEDSVEQLNSYLHEGEVFVARIGDEVVGHLQLVDDAAEIKNMAVEVSHRRRGVGRALIDEAIEVARGRGRSSLAVATAAADIGNLRFYQRAGFRLRRVERDAFTTLAGYRSGIDIDGIELRDQVWLDLDLTAGHP